MNHETSFPGSESYKIHILENSHRVSCCAFCYSYHFPLFEISIFFFLAAQFVFWTVRIGHKYLHRVLACALKTVFEQDLQ